MLVDKISYFEAEDIAFLLLKDILLNSRRSFMHGMDGGWTGKSVVDAMSWRKVKKAGNETNNVSLVFLHWMMIRSKEPEGSTVVWRIVNPFFLHEKT